MPEFNYVYTGLMIAGVIGFVMGTCAYLIMAERNGGPVIAEVSPQGTRRELALRAVLGAATPEYSLATWHGFTPALLMSIVALSGGVAVYFTLRSYLVSSEEGPPLLRHLKGQRVFDLVLVNRKLDIDYSDGLPIIERMTAGRRGLLQQGVNESGPYQSPLEDGMRHFHEFVQRELAPHL